MVRQLTQLFRKFFPDKSGSKIIVRKSDDGNWYWIGRYSNVYIDRDGEIISADAHRKAIDFLNRNPNLGPWLMTWHVEGTQRKARANWWDFDGTFMWASGPLTDDEAAAFQKTKSAKIGMSHGFIVLEKVGNVITHYVPYEVSELDWRYAANPYTGFSLNLRRDDMFNPTQRKYLVQRFGEEFVAALEKEAEAEAKALDEAGVARKSHDDAVDALIKAVTASLDLEGLAAAVLGRIKALEDEIEALKSKSEARSEAEPEPTLAAPVYDWAKMFNPVRDLPEEKGLEQEIDDAMADIPRTSEGAGSWMANAFNI